MFVNIIEINAMCLYSNVTGHFPHQKNSLISIANMEISVNFKKI